MPIPKLKIKKITGHKIIWPVISLIIVGLIITSGYLVIDHFQERFYPNTIAAGQDISGLTKQQANDLLLARWNNLVEQGWTFQIPTKTVTIYPTASLTEGAPPLLSFDNIATINQAWENNRADVWWQKLNKIITGWLFGRRTKAVIAINEKLLIQELQANFQSLITASQPAKITVHQDGTYQITPEITGQIIDYPSGLKEFGQQLLELQQQPITLNINDDQPLIQQSLIGNLQPAIEQYLSLAPIKLTASSSDWSINQAVLADWLALEIQAGQITVGPASSSISQYLTTKLATEIDHEPQAGQFQRSGGRLTQFRPGKDGQKLNVASSSEAISQAIRYGTSTVQLIIDEIKNPLNDTDPASLGIVDLLGTGTSTFTGSSANRIHNIKIGTNQISGQLIAPGTEFSVVKTLGDINAAAGYKQELVIKQNKTVAEYGGGLCQVGTTVFRAALASGLPITQRQNHSYRVSYYEPAGTDAAVYDPWPDLRFINDTNNYLLILGEIAGNQLSFSIWGTKDGRVVQQTKPIIYNIVKPPAKQIIETDTLPAGQIKCTERAHNGADTYFDYTVTYANGETKSKRFSSHYVPWREVCLVGKTTASTTTATTIPPTTTTPAITTTPAVSSTQPIATSTQSQQQDEL
jgi:vancomycin resistance protein YoaR